MIKYLSFFLALAAGVIVLAIVHFRDQPRANPTPLTVGSYQAPAVGEKLLPVGPDEANCPVMGMVGKKADMVKVEEKGTTYYLCCQECVPKFYADPERYINYPAAPTSRTCDT